ncbi:calcium-translocating P-type ATPase [Hypoxylon fragiforme]|uniref:calcium-translocating P-type ATPase n=1 Tax=Hypoxylon fragiforme TaxID=63214 RepID=UPI0020C66EAE|nr:calcium-translocating P-type ATPase [Hypoxylon fragiforme]KAI2610283.1 calcium-translocating P-type ATPase [Hypoxylon fragiforme]
MADPNPNPIKDGSEGTPRRARAPTITIDTTNDNEPSSTAPQQSPVSPHDESISPTTLTANFATERTAATLTSQPSNASSKGEVRPTGSFDSTRDSRPTSPHNVSSPVTSRAMEKGQAFLSVPENHHRSRQNSVDSDDGARSIGSSQGDTVTGAASWQGEKSAASKFSFDNEKIMKDETALKPDQGKESDFVVENNPFAYSPGQLTKMFNPKSLSAFYQLGGLAGMEKGLRSNRDTGLSPDEKHLDGKVTFEEATSRSASKLANEGLDSPQTPVDHSHPNHKHASDEQFIDRKRVYGDNRIPEKKGKSFLQLVWITYNDKVLILLSIAAIVSLAVGLYQTLGIPHNPDEPPSVEWIEGVAIIAAIVIVVLVGSLNDWQKERQFAKLNRKKQDRLVKVVRSGKTVEISIYDLLAGDVVHLEPGDLIPVDGILIQGFNVKCDESQATGESDVLRKRPADDVFAAIENGEDTRKLDPFIQSGGRVMEGVGTFLATSTGIYSSYGKTMMSLNEDPEITPLQSKLNVIAEYIAKLGGAAGLLLFIVLFIMFLVRLPSNSALSPSEKGQQFIEIFIVVVTIIVVAVPEGLPLAVTLALAFATNRMVKDNNLVRHLKACEVMGNATTICSDKTGTLTQNKMTVVAGTIGISHRFGSGKPQGENGPAPEEPSEKEFATSLSKDTQEILLKSISLNSTAFEGEVDGAKAFIGSKTETALLEFAKAHLGMGPISEERANAKILQLIPFDSGRKCMGIVVQNKNGGARLYVKGASEIVLGKCSLMLRDPTKDTSTAPLTPDNTEIIKGLIEDYASRSLRTIGIIYRDFERWPPRDARRTDGDPNEVVFEKIFNNMTFIGMVGIQDPLREGVPEAVKQCQRAGVIVRMVTGDNKLTAQAIAKECGILEPDGLVMEGPEFRNLSKLQQNEIIPRLRVLARSSPEDKRILVRRLKDLGETVAVTGDGTNDAPALKLADVGFSMGISGTEVAKEASAIILMDDNFTSIVKALKWGRAVNDAVKRFLQFQLTVNVTAVVLTFVTAVSSSDEGSVLTAVQLLWVNLIMDTLAALALATDPPQDSCLDRKPERRGANIISITMWKMILGQAMYQLAITFVLYYAAVTIGIAQEVENNHDQATPRDTLVFNTFVWMQIFNQWNNRRLDNKFNIFEGLSQNWYFLAINLAVSGAQVLIIFVGSTPFSISTTDPPQTGPQWATAIVLGAISIPVGMVIRLIPDELVRKCIPESLKKKSGLPGLTISDEEFNDYPEVLADVRDELAFLKKLKGGRLNNLKFAVRHPREAFIAKTRSPSHSRSNSIRVPQTPTREDSFSSPSPAPTPDSRKRSRSIRSRSNSALGAPTVMAGIIAGSVAAGWSPVERTGDRDFPAPRPMPSPLSNSELEPAPVLTEEPIEIEESSASNVPRLSVPQPPQKQKSIS